MELSHFHYNAESKLMQTKSNNTGTHDFRKLEFLSVITNIGCGRYQEKNSYLLFFSGRACIIFYLSWVFRCAF